MDTTITILQYKEILEAIKKHLGLDVSQYALSSLRYNLIYVMKEMRLNNHLALIKALAINPKVKEKLLSCLICESVSLFREPSLWRIFKTDILDIISKRGQIKIWLPELNNGSDLYSLLILLDHYGMRDKARITVSDVSPLNIDKSRKGELSKEILSNSILNLKHFDPNLDIKNYTYEIGKTIFIKKELLRGVFTVKGDFFEVKPSYSPNLVIFRNKLIYYNHIREQKAINYLHKNMIGGGFLITGTKENISMFEIDKKFRLINEYEQIYKRNF